MYMYDLTGSQVRRLLCCVVDDVIKSRPTDGNNIRSHYITVLTNGK